MGPSAAKGDRHDMAITLSRSSEPRQARRVRHHSFRPFLVLVLLLGVSLALAVEAGLRVDAVVGLVVFAMFVVGLEWLVAPKVIEHLVPATVIDHDGARYFTDDPI